MGRTIDFAPVAVSLRREVLRVYYEDGKSLVDAGGLNTLATNSGLAESRAAILERALQQAGVASLDGLDVVDIGCGFGALALVLAARGATVLAVDPNGDRFAVGRQVATEHSLPVRWLRASMEDMEIGERAFDVAVMNNSLCYLVPKRLRAAALRQTLTALRPNGVLVIRNPNRLHPIDQFTRLPFVGMLPPRLSHLVGKTLKGGRSNVRLVTHHGAHRELRRAGFTDVTTISRPEHSRLRETIAGYQHFTARRPAE